MPDKKLTLKEGLVIALGIPINTLGYVIVNHSNPFSTARFYWGYKQEQYWRIVGGLANLETREATAEKYMPLICYRGMIRRAVRRIEDLTMDTYRQWQLRYPTDWNRSLNPRFVPRQNNDRLSAKVQS